MVTLHPCISTRAPFRFSNSKRTSFFVVIGLFRMLPIVFYDRILPVYLIKGHIALHDAHRGTGTLFHPNRAFSWNPI